MDTKTVNQSVLIVKLFEIVLNNFSFNSEENTIFIFLCLIDVLIMIVQLMIIDIIWGKKKWVREYEMMVMMLVVFFSPFQISSIPS